MAKRIIIGVDIGHGAHTFPYSKGVFKKGKPYHEHHFNSMLGIEKKRLLELNGFQVYMAQKPFSDEVPLYERGDLYVEAGCDLVVSDHANANTSTDVEGRCVFYWHANSKTKKLAEMVIEEFEAKGYTTHGSGIHASKRGSWTDLYITRAIPIDSILIEHGFMTGTKDFDLVFGSKQKQYIKDMAEADVRAICKYYGRTFKSGKGGSDKVNVETVYRVQIGAYKHLNGAAALSHEIESKTKLDAYLTGIDGLIKVQVGAFHKKENADRRLSELQSYGYKDAFITTKAGTAVKEAEPQNDPIDMIPSRKVLVDGSWGKGWTRALQRHYGTPVDGVISGQPRNATTEHIYSVQYGTGGSMLIRAIQRDLGTIQDGKISYPSNMIKALQKKYGTPQTGKVGNPSALVKEMQKRYNGNRL